MGLDRIAERGEGDFRSEGRFRNAHARKRRKEEMKVTWRLAQKQEAVPKVLVNEIGVAEHEPIGKELELKRDKAGREVFFGIVVLFESAAVPAVADGAGAPNETIGK